MSHTWSAKDQKNTSQPGAVGQKRPRNDTGNKVTVVLGAQWGDEGKGKVVDLLATEADVVCRCQVKNKNKTKQVSSVCCWYFNSFSLSRTKGPLEQQVETSEHLNSGGKSVYILSYRQWQ